MTTKTGKETSEVLGDNTKDYQFFGEDPRPQGKTLASFPRPDLRAFYTDKERFPTRRGPVRGLQKEKAKPGTEESFEKSVPARKKLKKEGSKKLGGARNLIDGEKIDKKGARHTKPNRKNNKKQRFGGKVEKWRHRP